MFNWLHRLWQSIHPEKQDQDPALMAKDRLEEFPAPEAPQVTPKVESHIIVRGDRWPNTEETRWQLKPEPELPAEPGVEELIKQLERVDRIEIRRSAAQELGRMGPAAAPAIPALLTSAVELDPAVRLAALHALEAIDPDWPKNPGACKAFPHIVSVLNHWDPRVGDAAAGLLNRIGSPAIPDLVNVFSNEADTVDKKKVIDILARIGPEAASAVPGLTRALGSQFPELRIAAARALAKIGPAAVTALPALVAGLTDSLADGRQVITLGLASLGPAAEPAIPALLPLLADGHPKVREAAAAALKQISVNTIPALIEIVQSRHPGQLKALYESMLKDSPNDRKALSYPPWAAYSILLDMESLGTAQVSALRLLGKFGYTASAAVPSVMQALAYPNHHVRSAAARILVHIEPDARGLMPALVQMLIIGDEHSRKGAVEALGHIDRNWVADPDIAGTLADLAGQLGSQGGPGQAAVDIFVAIGESALPLLIDALASGNRLARVNAAKALGQIGPDAKAAIPALTRALQDSRPSVRDEAASALEHIAIPHD